MVSARVPSQSKISPVVPAGGVHRVSVFMGLLYLGEGERGRHGDKERMRAASGLVSLLVSPLLVSPSLLLRRGSSVSYEHVAQPRGNRPPARRRARRRA